jgi:hypothetical protein
VHHLEIIGEACRGLSTELKGRHPEVPWSAIVGMRNILVHDYFGINLDEVWSAVERDLPTLHEQISRKQVRIGEAERLIRHYRLSTGDQVGVVDLMLAMDEAGTEQAADLGYGGDAYFGSLERVLRSVVEALPSLPRSAIPSIEQRLRELARRSAAIGWAYGDTVHEITEPVVSPRAKARTQRRARRV